MKRTRTNAIESGIVNGIMNGCGVFQDVVRADDCRWPPPGRSKVSNASTGGKLDTRRPKSGVSLIFSFWKIEDKLSELVLTTVTC